MPRIVGVNIPEKDKIDLALTRIYGVGQSNVLAILMRAGISVNKRVDQLSDNEITTLNRVIGEMKVEGNLREEVGRNIERLKRIGSYRGKRHLANLPVRGQRTRTNARTKRGKRMTIGALKKEVYNVGKVEKGVEKEEKEEKK
ncbi:30S ribosomal protein S13 [Candidatus Shapirobacteria bacterium CG09_land_8_20_14_0_10_38_17]|uniref:Small ribosomal subunit protein uS13 n=1 Tax=Candidatus Shapirobacteria bacterium CG09_land_8_20_14_0_10_38_17 TaxID=1974884 RepID=A0A2H0WQS0_9BACT|nr:MAG: 30S ribosomal protein S13 [Candidatus Shapirobacteria bacterium CG09_land_8_20_14_0_10_38_17]